MPFAGGENFQSLAMSGDCEAVQLFLLKDPWTGCWALYVYHDKNPSATTRVVEHFNTARPHKAMQSPTTALNIQTPHPEKPHPAEAPKPTTLNRYKPDTPNVTQLDVTAICKP